MFQRFQQSLEYKKKNYDRSISSDISLTVVCIARIVEKNPTKFKIDNKELTVRRAFIEHTREEVKVTRIERVLRLCIRGLDACTLL